MAHEESMPEMTAQDANKLGKKITTLREAHHLSVQDLADRCSCDVEVIEGLEGGELPPSLAPLIKITRALGVRLGTLMDDDESFGPAYISTEQMEEVTRLKSLQTCSDAGDLSYFSLAAGRPSRHMDPFIITVTPSGEMDTSSSATRAKSGFSAWKAASRSSTARATCTSCIRARASTTTPSSRIRSAPTTARTRSSSPSSTRRCRRMLS